MKEFLQNFCSAIVAVLIVGGLLFTPFYIHSMKESRDTKKEINEKIDSFENIVNTMGQTDTLLLKEYTNILNKVNTIDGTYVEIVRRVSNVENGLRDINAELDACD